MLLYHCLCKCHKDSNNFILHKGDTFQKVSQMLYYICLFKRLRTCRLGIHDITQIHT